MNNATKKTAILYFTRSSKEEAKAKSFCSSGNFAQNRAVAEKLINHTHYQIKATGLPLHVFKSTNQIGNMFGEKLTNAFSELFEQGYEQVISVGNDCIELETNHIQLALNELNEAPIVAGPAEDGGVYLIGIKRRAFHNEAFRTLLWQTDQLLNDLSRYALQAGSALRLLKPLSDIDSADDLKRFLRTRLNKVPYWSLAISLFSISQTHACSSRPVHVVFKSTLFQEQLLTRRGPPVV